MKLNGKRVAFTGIAANYDRSDIHRMIETNGGTLAKSVNAKTDLLVIGDNPGNGVLKQDAARKHGVPTVSANDFVRFINGQSSDWPYGPGRATARKAKPAKVPKEVTTALTALSKNEAMAGFVGF